MYELTTEYDSRKSFYKKAMVKVEEGTKTLYSYCTKVAEIKDGKVTVLALHSNTTTRHIKEFLRQNGFNAYTSKQIMKDYGVQR